MSDRKPEGVIEADLCLLLSGDPTAEFLAGAPRWPFTLKVVRPPSGGAPIILNINVEENTAEILTLKYAAGLLRSYTSGLCGDVWQYNVPFRVCKAVVESWSFQEKHLEELPKTVGFKSDPELCMKRLDFDPIPLASKDELATVAPIFAGMLTRIKNEDALCMRIGSLYDPSADRKQAVWIYGPGDSGKSDVAWLVQEMSGNATQISNADLKTNFWKAALVGKRVGMVGEAGVDFIASDEFKAITGDDDHSINPKGAPIFHARIAIMLFFVSNVAPEIPYDPALMLRIIACKVDAIPADDRLPRKYVRERLRAEMPYIAGYCIARYASVGAGARLPTKEEDLKAIVDSYESRFLDFLEHSFIEGDPEVDFVMRERFYELMNMSGITYGVDQNRCKRVLFARMNCSEKRRRFETNATGEVKRLFVIEGIREREQEEKQFVARVRQGSGTPVANALTLIKHR